MRARGDRARLARPRGAGLCGLRGPPGASGLGSRFSTFSFGGGSRAGRGGAMLGSPAGCAHPPHPPTPRRGPIPAPGARGGDRGSPRGDSAFRVRRGSGQGLPWAPGDRAAAAPAPAAAPCAPRRAQPPSPFAFRLGRLRLFPLFCC